MREKSGWGAPVPKGHGRGVACNAYFGHTYIAYVVDLRVNGDGHAHIERVVAAVDCGIVVNPIGVEQQIEGGIIWGILGDKKGRLRVLYASIILYSIGNIANGFVQTVGQYAIVRFITGIGLAGELGAGITLVTELLPKEKRGIGTSMVAGFAGTHSRIRFSSARPSNSVIQSSLLATS